MQVDRFPDMLQKMEQMSPDERQKTLDEDRADCICGECPTYHLCMAERQELLFCLAGATACTVVKRVCLCPTCPVTSRMGLSHGYYCARGSEKEIRKIA